MIKTIVILMGLAAGLTSQLTHKYDEAAMFYVLAAWVDLRPWRNAAPDETTEGK